MSGGRTLFIFCLIFGRLTMIIAQKKGRNIWVALLVGFFLGIIGILIYAFMGKSEELKQKESEERFEKELRMRQRVEQKVKNDLQKEVE